MTTSGMEAPVHPEHVQLYSAKSILGNINSGKGVQGGYAGKQLHLQDQNTIKICSG